MLNVNWKNNNRKKSITRPNRKNLNYDKEYDLCNESLANKDGIITVLIYLHKLRKTTHKVLRHREIMAKRHSSWVLIKISRPYSLISKVKEEHTFPLNVHIPIIIRRRSSLL